MPVLVVLLWAERKKEEALDRQRGTWERSKNLK